MRVVHLQLSGDPGGIVSLCYSIAKNSKNTNYMYFLFEGGAVAKEMKERGIPVIVSNSSRYRWRKSIKQFVRFCEEEKIDVVINHMNCPIACAHVFGVKKYFPHIKIIGYMHSNQKNFLSNKKGKFFYVPLIRRMQRVCYKVVAISEFVKKTGMDTFMLESNKIEVIYNGIDCKKFEIQTKTNGKNEMNLIFVGRLIREKGVQFLIRAISQLSQNTKVHLHIVGYGPMYEELKELSEELHVDKRIVFWGKRMNIQEFLERAIFFVHPAICEEGFGITLVEAMAAGVPCIAYDGGAIPEIIDHNVNGFLVEKGSVEKLTEQIEQAYDLYTDGQYEKMSRAAVEKAKMFDIRSMVQKLEALYSEEAVK